MGSGSDLRAGGQGVLSGHVRVSDASLVLVYIPTATTINSKRLNDVAIQYTCTIIK